MFLQISFRPLARGAVQLLLLVSLLLMLSGCNWLKRVSVNSDGEQSNGFTPSASVSADGRYVAFQSAGSNLSDIDVAWDDVFVFDSVTNTTELISVNSAGDPGNEGSFSPEISGNGRYVAFHSLATNLAASDINGDHDVFVHDRHTGTTEQVSVDSAGNGGDGVSSGLSISHKGRFVAFTSDSENLVPDDTNGVRDIFVHDRVTGTTKRVSVDADGNQLSGESRGTDMSLKGRYIVYQSLADNLVPDDTNNGSDIFVYDQILGVTSRVSVDSAGIEGNSWSFTSSISADGRFVAFVSFARNLAPGESNLRSDVYVHDRVTGVTTRESICSACPRRNRGIAGTPDISADGRYVAWSSDADEITSGGADDIYDVFVRDRHAGIIWLESVDYRGWTVWQNSYLGGLSADGHYVAILSDGTLMPGDNNGTRDVYLRALGEIRVNSVSPRMVPIGSTTRVTIRGRNFLADAAVGIGGADKFESNIVIVDENTMTMDITVHADAAPGAREVFVWLSGTGPGKAASVGAECRYCLTFF